MTERRAVLFGGVADGEIIPVRGHTCIVRRDFRIFDDDVIGETAYLWQIMEDGEIIGVLDE